MVGAVVIDHVLRLFFHIGISGGDLAENGEAGLQRLGIGAFIRAGDRAAEARPTRRSVSSPADVVSMLRTAVEAEQSVLIGYVGRDGTVSERLVSPRRVDGGRLTAYDERTDDDLEFALHRITAVAPADHPA